MDKPLTGRGVGDAAKNVKEISDRNYAHQKTSPLRGYVTRARQGHRVTCDFAVPPNLTAAATASFNVLLDLPA